MKKMVLTILFIIALALLVLVGCVNFSTNIPGIEDAETEEPGTAEQPVTYYIPVTDEGGEQVTDNEGNHIYTPVVVENTDSPYEEDTAHYYDPNYDPYSTEEYPSDSPTGYVPTQAGNTSGTQQNIPTTGKKQETTTLRDPSVPTTKKNPSEPTTRQNPSESTTKRNPSEPTTRKNPAEPTTKRNSSESTTGSNPKEPTTSAPVNPNVNEYDIFRSGTFFATGTMLDSEGSSPLKMALTPNTIYMLTKFDNVDMAILVAGDKTYLIYPDAKAYLEVGATVMKLMGLDTDDLINAGDLGFTDLKSLSQADRHSQGTLNGKACTVYEFDNTDGSVCKVYMNGKRLLAIETCINGAITTATYIDSITGTVPADMQTPNPTYEKKSVFEFMGLLTDVIE